jgi:UDP-N-acetylglucosamine--N-acetylmuramyl-(pentapeptide) pyrophosphoryl-undecaprenol N-acetylglucosamine transferase
LFLSLYFTLGYFRRFKPGIIVGLGGYGSFSSIIIALVLRIPFVLLEQNVLPGKITRLFSPFARYVFCQWHKSIRYLRNRKNIKITGSPVRKEICQAMNLSREDARKKLNLSKENIWLILGGSQGAEALNQAVIENMEYLKKLSDQLGIIHLTGEKDFPVIRQLYQKAKIEALVKPFSEDMGIIYSASNFALTRAGGIAIAEMSLFGIPMILVPYSYSSENHQFFNAYEVERLGAGITIDQKFISQELKGILDKFLTDMPAFAPALLPLGEESLGVPDSAQQIICLLG